MTIGEVGASPEGEIGSMEGTEQCEHAKTAAALMRGQR